MSFSYVLSTDVGARGSSYREAQIIGGHASRSSSGIAPDLLRYLAMTFSNSHPSSRFTAHQPTRFAGIADKLPEVQSGHRGEVEYRVTVSFWFADETQCKK